MINFMKSPASGAGKLYQP